MKQYDLTIGMPVYNDVDFIEGSLKSILNQSFSDFKLIISDDGSIDGSREVCEGLAKIDSRIVYIRQTKNLGISKNMQYLLSRAKSKYFMWAGDDDLYDPTFVEKLVDALEKNTVVSAFCNFSTIDENNNIIETHKSYNYSNHNKKQRLIFFIKNSHDAFGYGIFKRQEIKGVEFPEWWWPNKKTPYNNIYPTLCYYLTKGDYFHIGGEPLFFKRVKTGKNVHHQLAGKDNAIKESLAFWIRKFNLFVFSVRMIKKAENVIFAFQLVPYLFFYWFIIPSLKQFRLAVNSFYKNRVKIK